MRSSLARFGLIYPVHLLRREWVPFYRASIGRLDQVSPIDLLRYQEQKLSRLLSHCHRHDPYYRHLLAEQGKQSGLMRPFDLLHQLPVLTKDIVRRESSKREGTSWQLLDRRSTSGSTGTPLVFWKDRLATGYMQAVQDHAYGWHGIEVGEAQGRFWGLDSGRAGQAAKLKDRLKNRIRFSAFDLSDEAKHAFYRLLLTFKPTYFYGYPSLMLEFARFLARENLSLASLHLKVAIGTGEYVYPHEREELEKLLEVPFACEYGCTETGVIGFECPHGRMHLMAANIVLEVVDSDGRPVVEGQEGKFVVTELNARYFPFIRYRIGDRGRLTGESCPCGRTLPVVELTAGRKNDYLILPSGKKVYAAILGYVLKKGVFRFQAVQELSSRLKIYIEPNDDFNEIVKNKYIKDIVSQVGEYIDVEIVLKKKIDRNISGKFSYFKRLF